MKNLHSEVVTYTFEDIRLNKTMCLHSKKMKMVALGECLNCYASLKEQMYEDYLERAEDFE
jgi:hypothetical protein